MQEVETHAHLPYNAGQIKKKPLKKKNYRTVQCQEDRTDTPAKQRPKLYTKSINVVKLTFDKHLHKHTQSWRLRITIKY